jgi:hypothetical protein
MGYRVQIVSISYAVPRLEKAFGNWRKLVEVTAPVYEPMPLMHYTLHSKEDRFHWSIAEEEVVAELNWLKGLNHLTSNSTAKPNVGKASIIIHDVQS